jgi:hypothetical protein
MGPGGLGVVRGHEVARGQCRCRTDDGRDNQPIIGTIRPDRADGDGDADVEQSRRLRVIAGGSGARGSGGGLETNL